MSRRWTLSKRLYVPQGTWTSFRADYFHYHFGITVWGLSSLREALSHHRLMQSVIKLVQGRCDKLVIAGGFATPDDFVGAVKAVVAQVSKSSSNPSVEVFLKVEDWTAQEGTSGSVPNLFHALFVCFCPCLECLSNFNLSGGCFPIV